MVICIRFNIKDINKEVRVHFGLFICSVISFSVARILELAKEQGLFCNHAYRNEKYLINMIIRPEEFDSSYCCYLLQDEWGIVTKLN